MESMFDDMVDHHWGWCPKCYQRDGRLNTPRGGHYFYCDVHKLAWPVGQNLFSDIDNMTDDELAAQERRLLTEFEPVEGFNPPSQNARTTGAHGKAAR